MKMAPSAVAATAEQGDALGQYLVGAAYVTGDGADKNQAEAVKWFRRSAEQGNADAQYNMGIFYQYGEGFVEKNIDEACRWFKMAAERGHEDAKKRLAQLAPEEKISFAFDETKLKADQFKGQTLVFKGFYLGMPISDALGLLNHYMGLQQVIATPIEDDSAMAKAQSNSNPEAAFASVMVQALGSQVQGMTPDQLRAQGLDDDAIAALGITDSSAPYRVFLRNGQQFVSKAAQKRPFAVADAAEKIIQFELAPEIVRALFGTMPTEEFLQTFVTAYDLPGFDLEREMITATIMGTTQEIGFQNIYRHRDAKGYEVIYYADSVILEDDMKTFADTPPEGTMTIKKIDTAEQRDSKFD